MRALIIAGMVLGVPAFGSVRACADDRTCPVTGAAGLGDYLANWFARVDQTQAAQPHWKAPLTTTTPLLTELLRYDQNWQRLPGGGLLQTFGSGKGVELIPAERIQLIKSRPRVAARANARTARMLSNSAAPSIFNRGIEKSG